jgi:hypothetical protein
METIQWTTSYKYTKDQAKDAYFSTHPLMLQAVIVKTKHLVKKLATRSCIGRVWQYQQCFPHPLKIKKTQKYVQGDTITTTRDMVESSDSEIDDFLTPSQMFKNLAV